MYTSVVSFSNGQEANPRNLRKLPKNFECSTGKGEAITIKPKMLLAINRLLMQTKAVI